MTYREAANRVEEHMKIHFAKEYPNAIQITEALKMAIGLLRERAALEDCLTYIQKGSPIWYVDFESGEIEKGEVFGVRYKDGLIDSFSVDFKESGDFDEFFGEAIGDNFFVSEEMAKQALINGHGMKG